MESSHPELQTSAENEEIAQAAGSLSVANSVGTGEALPPKRVPTIDEVDRNKGVNPVYGGEGALPLGPYVYCGPIHSKYYAS